MTKTQAILVTILLIVIVRCSSLFPYTSPSSNPYTYFSLNNETS